MLLEAIRVFGLSSRTAVKTLKEHPELVQQLSHYQVVTEQIPVFNVVVEPITLDYLRTAQRLSASHGLRTNDSLIAAVMQRLALTDFASNDRALCVVPGMTIWQPQPSTIGTEAEAQS
jgi:predicted nucleic acid-binding protein